MEVAKFYIINLKDRTDRKETAIKYLEAAGITNYEFIEAVHYSELSEEYCNDMTNRKYRFMTKRETAKKALLACGISHVKAIEKAIADFGGDYSKAIVIFEDDFHINEEADFISKLNEGLKLAPADWELIHLGGIGNDDVDKTIPFAPGLDIAKSVWGAHAYAIRNSKEILQKFKDAFEDGYFADRATRKIARDDKKNPHKYLVFNPFLVVQWKSWSDIDNRPQALTKIKNRYE